MSGMFTPLAERMAGCGHVEHRWVRMVFSGRYAPDVEWGPCPPRGVTPVGDNPNPVPPDGGFSRPPGLSSEYLAVVRCRYPVYVLDGEPQTFCALPVIVDVPSCLSCANGDGPCEGGACQCAHHKPTTLAWQPTYASAADAAVEPLATMTAGVFCLDCGCWADDHNKPTIGGCTGCGDCVQWIPSAPSSKRRSVAPEDPA